MLTLINYFSQVVVFPRLLEAEVAKRLKAFGLWAALAVTEEPLQVPADSARYRINGNLYSLRGVQRLHMLAKVAVQESLRPVDVLGGFRTIRVLQLRALEDVRISGTV